MRREAEKEHVGTSKDVYRHREGGGEGQRGTKETCHSTTAPFALIPW